MSGHGHAQGGGARGMPADQQAQMQQMMRKRQMEMMGKTMMSTECGIPTPDGQEPFEISGEQVMMTQQMSQMMQQMIASATGLAFSQMQATLTEEQKAISAEAMELAKKATSTAMGQQVMERAMGSVLKTLTADQETAFKSRVHTYVVEHVPDDTTQALLFLGVRVRKEELKIGSLTSQEQLDVQQEGNTKAQQVIMASIDPQSGQPTEEAKQTAQEICDEHNALLLKMFTPEYTVAKDKFMAMTRAYQELQYYQIRVSTTMGPKQMQIMQRAQMAAQTKDTMAEKFELMGKFNRELHSSFNSSQARWFLKFRTELAAAGADEYLQKSITELAEARMNAAEPEPEPEPEDSWSGWIGGAAKLAAGAVVAASSAAASVFLEEEDAGKVMDAEAAAAKNRMLTVDGRSLEFEQASFGERAAALVNAKVIKCEPFSCSIALSNGDQISGNIAFCVRGDCGFVDKARACQVAGAVAMIVVNTEDSLGKLVGQGDDIGIPCVCIKSTDGSLFSNDSIVTLRL